MKRASNTISRVITAVVVTSATILFAAPLSRAQDFNVDMSRFLGSPMGGASEDDVYEKCPHGVETVTRFLKAWQEEDYRSMYDMLDEQSRQGYTFDQARFDFQFAEFKEFTITSIRKSGDDYEFLLSHGDFRDNDRDTRKMYIDGTTFKVKLLSSGNFMKRSLDSYF